METIKNILLGCFFIIIGLLILYYSYKRPTKSVGLRATNFSGYISGIGFILLGILQCFGYFHK
jgi:hypothetical protein